MFRLKRIDAFKEESSQWCIHVHQESAGTGMCFSSVLHLKCSQDNIKKKSHIRNSLVHFKILKVSTNDSRNVNRVFSFDSAQIDTSDKMHHSSQKVCQRKEQRCHKCSLHWLAVGNAQRKQNWLVVKKTLFFSKVGKSSQFKYWLK